MTDNKPSTATPAGPCALVIFGAGGDLTGRLIVPALYNLTTGMLLPEQFAILGVDIAELDDDSWRAKLGEKIQDFVRGAGPDARLNENAWNWLQERMSYLRGDLNDRAAYENIKSKLAEIEQKRGTGGNCLFYLAIADRFFGTVIGHLGASQLVCEKDGQWRRVVIEKPFGHDVASAAALNEQILRVLRESQIYRI
ncbi:MAG: glucose-6-phosphate dehydrogenase, partial [Terriglobia bacterium]